MNLTVTFFCINSGSTIFTESVTAAVIGFYSAATTGEAGSSSMFHEGDMFNLANGTEMFKLLSTWFCPSGGVVLDLSGSQGITCVCMRILTHLSLLDMHMPVDVS